IQYWHIIYPANYYEEGRSRIWLLLLINTNINTDSYMVLPIPHSDITGVRFTSANGSLTVINVYNEITNNDTTDCLDSFLTANLRMARPTDLDHMLWLGDFNRHHLMWEDDTNSHLFEPENYISPLLDLLYRHNMLLTLPKGIPTFQTSVGCWTRPDNVWRSNTNFDPIQRCNILPNIHPPLADHMPIITVIDLPIPRSSAPQALDFRAANWSDVNNTLKVKLMAESQQ